MVIRKKEFLRCVESLNSRCAADIVIALQRSNKYSKERSLKITLKSFVLLLLYNSFKKFKLALSLEEDMD